MRVAYIRVSTVLQHTERQEDRIDEMNVEKVFIEKISAKDRNRPQLKAMMEYVREGDTVVVTELSRLGRSVIDLYEIANELKSKGVKLESLKENIDLSTATGNLTFGILAIMAQFERELMLERQKEGIAAAKARDRTWGAKKQYGTDERYADEVFQSYFNKEIKYADAVDKLGMKRGTFYYQYNQWKAKHEAEREEIEALKDNGPRKDDC